MGRQDVRRVSSEPQLLHFHSAARSLQDTGGTQWDVSASVFKIATGPSRFLLNLDFPEKKANLYRVTLS